MGVYEERSAVWSGAEVDRCCVVAEVGEVPRQSSLGGGGGGGESLRATVLDRPISG